MQIKLDAKDLEGELEEYIKSTAKSQVRSHKGQVIFMLREYQHLKMESENKCNCCYCRGTATNVVMNNIASSIINQNNENESFRNVSESNIDSYKQNAQDNSNYEDDNDDCEYYDEDELY